MPAAPTQDNLYLGAGELLLNRFDEDGLPTGLLHLGNVETFELTTTDDRIQKFSSMSAGRPLYAERTRRRNVVLRLTIDEFNAENMALALMGSVVDYTQAATPVTDEVLVAAAAAGVSTGLKLGAFYKVASFMIGTVTVTSNGGLGTVDADWELYNDKTGVIHIPEDSSFSAGDDLKVSYTPLALVAEDGWRRIRGGVDSNILASLLFIPDPSVGVPKAVQVWNVSISPDGALGLISEDYAQFALSMAVQDDSDGRYGGSVNEPLYAVTEMATA